MNKIRYLAAVILLHLAVSGAAWGLTIKIGSLAPTGSPWDLSLRRIAAAWYQASNGTVEVKIYPGGIAGDEPDMIRKMRIGQLDSAGITVIGLNEIFSGTSWVSA